MPDWREIALEWEELGVLSTRWKSKLTEWRGIYYIFDYFRYIRWEGLRRLSVRC